MELDWERIRPKLSERTMLEIANVGYAVQIEDLEAEVKMLRHTIEKLEQAVRES